jgi:hypothetical protein
MLGRRSEPMRRFATWLLIALAAFIVIVIMAVLGPR